MRAVLALGGLVVCLAGLRAQAPAPAETKPGPNYGVDVDLDTYPQGTPKDALGSVVLAISRNRVDYLLAQLADPEWVQMRIKGVDGTFEGLVKETSAQLAADPTAFKDLQRLSTEGEWETAEATASAHLKDRSRRAFFRKIGDRWFLENKTR